MRKVKFIISLFVLMLGGCSDVSESEEVHVQNQVNAKLLDYLKTTASILGNLVLDPEIREEIVYGVALDYQGDSQILLAHLLDESDQAFYARKSPGKFRKEFLKELGIGSTQGRIAGTSEFVNYLTNHNVGIYSPYFSNHNWRGEEVTITYHPLISEKSNIGRKYLKLPDGSFEITNVTVDDDYAFNHPTLIVTPVEDCSDCVTACPSDWCITEQKVYAGTNYRTADFDCRDYSLDAIVSVSMPELMLDTHWDNLFG